MFFVRTGNVLTLPPSMTPAANCNQPQKGTTAQKHSKIICALCADFRTI
jgi:hypothetical protein